MITDSQQYTVWKKSLIAGLAGFLFGLISGYAGVLINHHNEGTFGGNEHQYQYQFLTIPSSPGDFIAWQAAGGHDWLLDEGWNYRVPVTLWNGVFWLVVAVLVVTLKTWSGRYPSKSRRIEE